MSAVHQYGLFKFRTNNPSRPATPSGSHRSRAHIFGLDVISRNLFGASRSSKDSFGSVGSHRRSKSAMTRANTLRTDLTGTSTTTSDSSMKFSSRSTSTAATSLSSFVADEDSFAGDRSTSKSRKLVKRNRSRSRSPGSALAYGSESESEYACPRRRRSRSMSQAEGSVDYSDHEDISMNLRDTRVVSQSEMDLIMRLQLARRNSKNQHVPTPMVPIDLPVEETIYEGK